MKRRAVADSKIKSQSICSVEPAGRRLKIKRCEVGPLPVELKRTRDVERISEALAAQCGSPTGKFGD